MSNANDLDNETTNGGKPKSNKAFDAYAVRNDRDGNGYFHKIGAAFAHKDKEGFDIDLVATPTNGRITLRTPKDRLDKAREDTRQPNAKGSRRSRRRDQERDR